MVGPEVAFPGLDLGAKDCDVHLLEGRVGPYACRRVPGGEPLMGV